MRAIDGFAPGFGFENDECFMAAGLVREGNQPIQSVKRIIAIIGLNCRVSLTSTHTGLVLPSWFYGYMIHSYYSGTHYE